MFSLREIIRTMTFNYKSFLWHSAAAVLVMLKEPLLPRLRTSERTVGREVLASEAILTIAEWRQWRLSEEEEETLERF